MNPPDPFKPRFVAPFRRRLSVLWIDESVLQWGPELRRLRYLRKLHLQGDLSLCDSKDFSLPTEIGELHTLRTLTLLNLPISFPEWIAQLTNLRYLYGAGNQHNQDSGVDYPSKKAAYVARRELRFASLA